MAFPQVASSASGNSGANATTHTVTVHAGTIAAGQLLLVFFSNDGAGVTASVTTPASGWTRLVDQQVNNTTSAARFSVFYRWADGGEATTITVTTTASEGSAWTSYRITGADSGTNPEAALDNSPTSTTPEPPTLDPAGWGSEDTLWFVAYGWDANVAHSSYPANYTDNQLTNRWANTGGTGVASASRELAASSVTPGTGGIASSEQWGAVTVAIRPSGGAGSQTVSPGVLGGYTLFSPTIQPGGVSVSPAILGGATVFAPTINQKVALALLGGATIFAPTVTPGNVNVSPALLGGGQVFAFTVHQSVAVPILGGYAIFAPVVSNGVGGQTVSPDLLGGYVLFSPTVTPGGVSVAPDILGGHSIFAPTVQPGGVSVSPDVLGGYVIFAPTVQPGGVSVSPALLGGYVMFAPTITTTGVTEGTATATVDDVMRALASMFEGHVAIASLDLNHNATASVS